MKVKVPQRVVWLFQMNRLQLLSCNRLIGRLWERWVQLEIRANVMLDMPSARQVWLKAFTFSKIRRSNFLSNRLWIVLPITPLSDAKVAAEMALLSISEKRDWLLIAPIPTRASRTTARKKQESTSLSISMWNITAAMISLVPSTVVLLLLQWTLLIGSPTELEFTMAAPALMWTTISS